MSTVRKFRSIKTPEAAVYITFNFTDALALSSDLIVSAVVTPTVHKGTDADPSSMLSGAPFVSADGLKVSQHVVGGLDEVQYMFHCLATTNALPTAQQLPLCGVLKVKSC